MQVISYQEKKTRNQLYWRNTQLDAGLSGSNATFDDFGDAEVRVLVP